MKSAIQHFDKELNSLRTSRANPSMLEPIVVDAYSSKVPINQVSNISVPESRLITVQVWDESLINTVENAIRNSDLGLNPMIEGNLIKSTCTRAIGRKKKRNSKNSRKIYRGL